MTTILNQSPTAEQRRAIDLASTGNHLTIEALAGTGKTTTLQHVAHHLDGQGVYLAFNRAIVDEAKRKFPRRKVDCATAHSMAWGAVGHAYDSRLQRSTRILPGDVARILKCKPIEIDSGWGRRRLTPAKVASLTLRAIREFCRTDDPEPTWRHVPLSEGLDPLGVDGKPQGGPVHHQVAQHVATYLPKAWADLTNPSGALPYEHAHYLKEWALTSPVLHGDWLLFDEAQDANPLLLSIVKQQTHMQLCFVGDTFQQIYSWNGAVNAMAQLPGERCWLTQSWRFGPDIAAEANLVLAALGSEVELAGNPRKLSTVGIVDNPDVVLCRTNACAVDEAFAALDEQYDTAIVGGADDIVRFAWAANDLQEHRDVDHPELGCFGSWSEVLEYCEEHGDLATDLVSKVRLIQRHGARRIGVVLKLLSRERDAQVVISTAHKAKGREWPLVRLAGDFPDQIEDDAEEELRLLYVAITRATARVDVADVGVLARLRPAPV